ncbi:unnamed protein product [Gadus morhua 'NCC']
MCVCVCMSAYAPAFFFCLNSIIFFIHLCNFFPGPDLQVKVFIPPYSPNWVQLECHSMCHVTRYPTYIWYRDGTQGRFDWFNINSEYRTSCAVQGSEHLPSPSVYAPETPSVGWTPSGVIKEGSSVNLTCTSEANPVAKYTWTKVTTGHSPGQSVQGQQLSFHPIQSSDSGQYLCKAKNDLGRKTSSPFSIDVKSTPSSLPATVAAGTVAVLLATILLLIFLWMRRKRASRKARGQGGRPDTRQESPPCPVYDNVSALTNRSASAAQREPIEEQDDPHYASIHISRSKNQEVPGVEEAMGADNSGVLYALWSYQGQAADELGFNEGDMKAQGVDWWWASLCGREGFVPNNYFGSDSAEYKFRITTNNGGALSDLPGVKLSVTDLQVKVVIPPTRPNWVFMCCSRIQTSPLSISVRPRDPLSGMDSPWCNRGGQFSESDLHQRGQPSSKVHLDQDGPKHTFVIPSPPGEIMEGGSVTLSCSSDANPAADYTWFKDNQPLLWEPSRPYTLDSVSSKDRGTYRCQAENQYGYLGSNSVFIDVLYAPKTPSVSVRPPGEIKEGGSVTLSCSSDANPAADYTWFREHGGSVEELGENYTITGTVAVLLATMLLVIFLWMSFCNSEPIRYETFKTICRYNALEISFKWKPSRKSPPCPVYGNVSALTNRSASAAQREPIEEQDDLHYASIHISRSKNQEVPRGFAGALVKSDYTEQVLYSAINLKRTKAVPE